MWQSLLRSWLLRSAQDQLRDAAAKAASGQTTGGKAPNRPADQPTHVGVVFALELEAAELVDRLTGVVRTEGAGFVAYEGELARRGVAAIVSGPGRMAATKATEALVLGHRPQWIVSAGLAGGLVPELAVGDVIVADTLVDESGARLPVEAVIDAQWLRSVPRLRVGTLLSADRIIRTSAEKQALGQKHTALAVEMESWGVADICRRLGVQFAAIRAISDTASHDLPGDIDFLLRQTSTAGRLGAAAGAIFRRPGTVKDLWQLKENAIVAADCLGATLAGFIGQSASGATAQA